MDTTERAQPFALRDRYGRRELDRTAREAVARATCRACLAEAARPKGRPRFSGWDLVFSELARRVELVAYGLCAARHHSPIAYVTL